MKCPACSLKCSKTTLYCEKCGLFSPSAEWFVNSDSFSGWAKEVALARRITDSSKSDTVLTPSGEFKNGTMKTDSSKSDSVLTRKNDNPVGPYSSANTNVHATSSTGTPPNYKTVEVREYITDYSYPHKFSTKMITGNGSREDIPYPVTVNRKQASTGMRRMIILNDENGSDIYAWITIPIISANGRILRMYSGEHVLFVLVTIVWDEESQTMTNHSSNSTDYDQSKQKVSFSDYLEKDVGCGGGCVILLLIAFIPVAPKVSIVLLIITIVIILLRK